jgi:hypothetical protein
MSYVITWVVDPRVLAEYTNELKSAVINAGGRFVTHEFDVMTPNSVERIKLPAGPVISHGSVQFMQAVLRRTDWQPGAFCTLADFDCLSYYPQLGDELVNSRYIMLPYGDMVRQSALLYATLGQTGSVFVKPSSGGKTFDGIVVARRDADIVFVDPVIPPDTLCLVAPVQEILHEWRFVVADGVVVTGSQYKKNGALNVMPVFSDSVLRYAQGVASKVRLTDRVWTLDIAEINDKHKTLKVLEINSFSSAGLYACNYSAIVTAVRMVAAAIYNDVN